ncbi:YdcF family protein [Crenobacter caeni]|uniref:YdcF family protein n=1 Tax=Crenobacter caeni TaxID=2705474 RepID=A0A6B2KQZ0_9NEIS|nr:YdcF family protein [Crenobacter caeni]NDV12327.1 YdcF family protein [Crenobacter caeni]
MPVETAPGVLARLALGSVLLPPVNMLLIAAIGGVLAWRGRRRLGLSLLALAALFSYLMATPRVAMWLNAGLEPGEVARVPDVAKTGAIVVLGGGKKPAPEYGGNELTADASGRLRYAAFLSRQTGVPLLLTGGAPLGGEPEAWVMQRTLTRDYLLEPKWVESEAVNTADNARLAAAMLKTSGVTRITLVSQAWHLKRAIPLFEAQGLKVLPAPTGFTRYDGGGLVWWLPSGRAMQESHQALREYVGLLYHALGKVF